MICGAIVKDKKVLLMRRFDIGVWEVPGDGTEFGENPEQTLMREIKEEVGINIKNKGILCVVPAMFFVKDKNIEKHLIHLVYLCEPTSEQVIMNDEHSDYKWVTYEEGMRIGFNNKTDENGKLNRLAFGTDKILEVLKQRNLID